MSWTDERINYLEELWVKGLSARQIADQLGNVTRNAVIGKIHRMGLSHSRPVEYQLSIPNPRAKSLQERIAFVQAGLLAGHSHARIAAGIGWKDSSTVSRFKKRHLSPTSRVRKRKKKKLAPRLIEPVNLIIDTPTSSSKTTLELGPNDCKWPIGDPKLPGFVHCGHKRKEGSPYCENHHARAHPQGVYVSKAGRTYKNGVQV